MSSRYPFDMRIVLLVLVSALLIGCEEGDIINPWAGEHTLAMKPIYAPQLKDYGNIRLEDPRDFTNLGNIISVQDRLLIVDFFTGVHLVDNSNPAAPVNTGFITIPGAHTITYSDQVLFANYGTELVLIDLSDLSEIKVISSVQDFYTMQVSEYYPRNYHGPFECVDQSQGILNGWEQREVFHPRCWL